MHVCVRSNKTFGVYEVVRGITFLDILRAWITFFKSMSDIAYILTLYKKNNDL